MPGALVDTEPSVDVGVVEVSPGRVSVTVMVTAACKLPENRMAAKARTLDMENSVVNFIIWQLMK
jgi:hypothetical protein